MQDHELDQGELGVDLEADSFEFETGDEFEVQNGIGGPLNEVEEMELAAELLSVSSEEELDQFLGKFFKRAWRGIKKVARPLGGILKGIAKKALPFVGGALGSFIPIPGVGTALGTAIGGAASNLLEVDLEGMSPEDQEFELARRFVRLGTLEFVVDRDASGRRRGGPAAGGGLEAPMPGVVTRVLVAAGDQVTKGQPLLALEAMKMEHLIRAPRDGRIASVAAAAGAMVQGGATLVELEP